MKSYFLLLLTAISISVSAQKVINDANVEVRSVGTFSGIAVSHGIDLYLSQGDEAVAVSSTKAEHTSRIITEVKAGVLTIKYDGKGLSGSYNSGHLRAYVSVKQLKSLEASGGSDVTVDGSIKADDFTLAISGGSDFKGAVDASTFTVKQSGGSDVKVAGSATTLVVDASGGSDFSGYDLSTETCVLQASGGSDIEVTAKKELTAKASGASDIAYRGNPAVREATASGASSVKAKGDR